MQHGGELLVEDYGAALLIFAQGTVIKIGGADERHDAINDHDFGVDVRLLVGPDLHAVVEQAFDAGPSISCYP